MSSVCLHQCRQHVSLCLFLMVPSSESKESKALWPRQFVVLHPVLPYGASPGAKSSPLLGCTWHIARHGCSCCCFLGWAHSMLSKLWSRTAKKA